MSHSCRCCRRAVRPKWGPGAQISDAQNEPKPPAARGEVENAKRTQTSLISHNLCVRNILELNSCRLVRIACCGRLPIPPGSATAPSHRMPIRHAPRFRCAFRDCFRPGRLPERMRRETCIPLGRETIELETYPDGLQRKGFL